MEDKLSWVDILQWLSTLDLKMFFVEHENMCKRCLRPTFQPWS
jgi:hypothetical protein